MSEAFGNVGDPDNKSFSPDGTPDNGTPTGGVDITPEELAELRKRDANAQQHIPTIESENEQLRQQMAELETQLEGSATLKAVLDKIENKSDGNTNVNPDDVAAQVEARLQAKAKEETQQANFDKVFSDLMTVHGTKEAVDKYVVTKAAELGMDANEATRLARTAPDAFMKLYASEGQPAPQQGVASAAGQQTSVTNAVSGTEVVRDKAYYSKMMKENPKKYWKVETQAQMRRDVYGAE